MQQSFDFHVHSWYSYDAHLSPEQIFDRAEEAGLTAIAIADHHNMDGFAAFEAAADAHPAVAWVPAMEVSAHTTWGEFDFVALGVPPDAPWRLADVIDRYRDWMRELNRRLLAGFEALDVPFGEAEKQQMLSTWRPGPAGKFQGEVRLPNRGLMPWLIERGYLADEQGYGAFFRRVLDGVGGYPPVPPATEVLPRFAEVGATLILAHPGGFLQRHGAAEFARLVWQAGVHGIESGHKSHTPEQNAAYAEFAGRHDLLVSGGSDVHFVRELSSLGDHGCTATAAAGLLTRLGL